MPPSAESPAKRQKMAEKRSMQDVPADEFVSMLDLFDGPKVLLVVGVKEYKLPKRLACHSSTFFSSAFNSDFKEGETQELALKDTPAEAFELVIQWMFTGQMKLPVTVQGDTVIISRILDFLKVADFLDLGGNPSTSVTDIRKERLKNSREVLDHTHIFKAMALPSEHIARKLIFQACAVLYCMSLGGSLTQEKYYSKMMSPFKFKEELMQVDGFAAELFRAFDEVRRTKDPRGAVKDPLTGASIYNV